MFNDKIQIVDPSNQSCSSYSALKKKKKGDSPFWYPQLVICVFKCVWKPITSP